MKTIRTQEDILLFAEVQILSEKLRSEGPADEAHRQHDCAGCLAMLATWYFLRALPVRKTARWSTASTV